MIIKSNYIFLIDLIVYNFSDFFSIQICKIWSQNILYKKLLGQDSSDLAFREQGGLIKRIRALESHHYTIGKL
ncbi:hypothetical protein Avbf_01499 [Armadillidium vulgare]|nr:hypothetical protein Avbf_01499 [Armadillidium vulgare]